MSINLFITTFIKFLLFAFASISLGSFFVGKRKKILEIEEIGITLLLGIGLIGYLSLLMGVIGQFKQNYLLIILMVIIFINLRGLVKVIRSIIVSTIKIFKDSEKSLISLTSIVLIIAVAFTLYLSALQPPYAADELHYHLPQIREILITQNIDLSFGGHLFYGNLPKLMDVIFALASSLGGYSLGHTYNYLVLISFLAVLFGIVKKHSSTKTALISVLLIIFFDDLTWNATTGYIDTATLSYEISALLIVVDWVISKKSDYKYLSAILLGFSLSIKYSPLPTVLYILATMVIGKIKIKEITKYIFTALLFGGFWYVKNFIEFLNPFYPLYFGHKGYGETQYISLVNAIQEFGPKTPKYFFELTKGYLSTTGIFVFISLYFTPLSFIFQKKNKFFNILAIYSLVYTLYWFFLSTHQIRFLMPSLVSSLIVFSEVVSRLTLKKILIFSLLGTAILVPIYFFVYQFDYKSVWSNFWNTKLHLVERQYALGNITQDEFLYRNFGCQYDAIRYLNNNNIQSHVIDNWSVWHAPSISFYALYGQFMTYGNDQNISEKDIINKAQKENINYIFIDSKVKEKHLNNRDPVVIESKNKRLPTEKVLLKISKVIYEKDSCRLYKINY